MATQNFARLKTLEWIVAAALSILLLVLLSVRAQHAGALWRDECASVQLSQMPTVTAVLQNFQRESFPAPFPLAIRAYSAMFGTSDVAFRAFGFGVGFLLLVVCWLNAWMTARQPPLVALTFFGLNASFLTWGTTIRGYGLGSVLILLAFGLLAKYAVAPAKSRMIPALAACLFSVQFLLYNSVLLMALTTAALGVCWRRRDLRTAIVIVLIGAMCAISMVPEIGPFRHESTSTVVFRGPVDFTWFWEQFLLTIGNWGAVAVWASAGAGAIVFAVLWLTVRSSSITSEQRDTLFFSLLALFFSALLYFAFLKVVGYRTREWYYVALLAVLAGAFDLAFATLANFRWIRIARLGVVVVAAIVFTSAAWPKVHERQTNMDVIARAMGSGPDDLIVINPWFLGISFNWYYRGNTPWVTCPLMDDHHLHRFDLLKEKVAATNPIDDLLQRIRTTLQAGHQVSFIGEMKILPPDRAAIHLPPAPRSEFGWSGDAYSETWSQQIGEMIRDHARTGAAFPLPADVNSGAVNELENVTTIYLAQGWHD